MRKLLIGLFIYGILSLQPCYADTVFWDSIVSADDLTIAWLNGFKNTVIDALNSFDGENIQDGTITASELDNNTNPEVRWGEAFNEFVYTGLLAVDPGSGLDMVTPLGTAYVKNDTTNKMTRVVKDAIPAYTYTASKDTYVDLSSNGTYTYSAASNGAAAPAVAANSIRLFKVVTDGTDITSVTDLRVTGVQISTNEDYLINGFELLWTATDRVSTDAGVLYNGATRIDKTSATGLNVGTAADYISGASERGTSKWLYVYCDDSGSIKLDDNAPDYADASGNTVGIKRYYLYSTEYWRYIGSIRLNATGSGNIEQFTQDDEKVIYDVPINITTSVSAAAWSSATSCATAIPPTSFLGIFGLAATDNASGTGAIYIRPNGTTWTTNLSNSVGATGANAIGAGGQRLCFTDSSQQIQYQNTTSETSTRLDVEGYIYKRE